MGTVREENYEYEHCYLNTMNFTEAELRSKWPRLPKQWRLNFNFLKAFSYRHPLDTQSILISFIEHQLRAMQRARSWKYKVTFTKYLEFLRPLIFFNYIMF